MNIKNLLLVLSSAAALTSCSTAYRSGQTPDDVYYSPSRPQGEEYVDVERQQGRYDDRANQGYNNYEQAYDNYRDDRFLRMSVGNPMRLSAYNDFSMYYGGLGFNTWRYNNFYNMGYNSPWSGLSYWNSFYNPYSAYDYYMGPSYFGHGYGYGGLGYGGYLPGNVIVKTPNVNPVSRPRSFNPGSYGVTPNYSNTSMYVDRPAASTTNSRYAPSNNAGRYNNRNTNSSNSSLRRILSGSSDNTYYNNGRTNTNSANTRSANTNSNPAPVRTYEAPTRSYSPPASTGGGGGAGSSSGGGGGVSRPTRGGGN